MSTEREIVIENHEESITQDSPSEKKYPVILPVSSVRKKAQSFLEDIYDREDDDVRQDLYELMERFEAQNQQSGDADDFHNLAVAFALYDEYAFACRVLESGLKLFPKNVDLLADYLQYGTDCNKFEKCKEIYKTLVAIPHRRWTWRGFTFVVDYLQFLLDRSNSDLEIDEIKGKMLYFVGVFREHFPYSEESYRTEADVYRSLNLPDKETETLKNALEMIQVAPKCALRYADILFERGKYQEASNAIQRAIIDSTRTQSSVNEGYLFYLSALCKIAIVQQPSTELSLNEEVANEIYSDFNIALSKFQNIRNSFTEVIRTKTNTIINKSGTKVSAVYELLYDFIES